ncbi:unnamed protein product [Lactuca virosa]|uniref:Uncharacterized protein n=1 Tax=Lactuca virosa TaxID=75947 RepID=A0AAU9PPC1_9ASTR|nr:unnamed protein product [Lactuca virosa]
MVGGLLPRRIVLQLQKANKLNCLLMLCPSQLNSLICAAKVLNQARKKLRHHSVAVQMSIGLEEDFQGLVDYCSAGNHFMFLSYARFEFIYTKKIKFKGFHTNDLQQSLLEKGEVAS